MHWSHSERSEESRRNGAYGLFWRDASDDLSMTPIITYAEVHKDGQIVVGAGNPHAGIIWTQDFPKCDHELEMKVSSLAGYNQPGR